MDARIQDLPFDPATLQRLSPGLINSHHQNNYGGAVKRLNAIRRAVPALQKGRTDHFSEWGAGISFARSRSQKRCLPMASRGRSARFTTVARLATRSGWAGTLVAISLPN